MFKTDRQVEQEKAPSFPTPACQALLWGDEDRCFLQNKETKHFLNIKFMLTIILCL